MNTCPVYRRSGGHSYGSTVPGPIGAILTPGFDLERYRTLPFASTLCGSCSDVCPVKIDIHAQLYAWRQVVTEAGLAPQSKRRLMRWAGHLFARPKRYRLAGWLMRTALRLLPHALVHRLTAWGRQRDLPEPPKESFRSWYVKHQKSS